MEENITPAFKPDPHTHPNNSRTQGSFKIKHCYYCEYPIPHKLATKDHIIPLSLFGTNHPANKVICCIHCNRLKTNYLPSHLAEILEYMFIPNAIDEKIRARYEKIAENCRLLEHHIEQNIHLMCRAKIKNDQ